MLRSAAGSTAVYIESKDGVNYPAGSKQQIVYGTRWAAKGHQDATWIVERPWSVIEQEKASMVLGSTAKWREMDEKRDAEKGPVEVRSGDAIRLSHAPTGRNFHSHHISANITARDNEVTTFYTRDYGDPNDIFILETVRGGKEGGVARVGKWEDGGYVCPTLPETPPGYYKPSFISDVISTNIAMSNANSQLVDSPDKPPAPFQSHPWEWPILWHGLRVVNWDDKNVKYFMFGNPIIWWGGFLSLVSFFVVSVIGGALWMRFGGSGLPFGDDLDSRRFGDAPTYGWWFGGGSVAFLGWLCHYVPFWSVSRVL
ncbi:Protein O-mannosyltransferase 2, partial [Gonapodya sp. JEL0774]